MQPAPAPTSIRGELRQLTNAPYGHILTNCNVWSADSQWIFYDIRSDQSGSVFDGDRIERVHVATGKVEILYQSRHGAACGVVTCSPCDSRIVFIHGPENPSPEWNYAASRRCGTWLDYSMPDNIHHLDARNLTPPFTPGALRGGTHLHTYSGDGQWVAFTYEDEVLRRLSGQSSDHDHNQRNVGISIPAGSVQVAATDSRDHSGTHFSVLVTDSVNQPQPGSDQISRACEEAWIGKAGYLRSDGQRVTKALAFQGTICSKDNRQWAEVFVVDLPEDVTAAMPGRPLEGTSHRRPAPPLGTSQRRLTYTQDRVFPGLSGPRHWLQSSPDGSEIAFLMKDEQGIVQLFGVSPNGGPIRQMSNYPWPIASAFTWSPDGKWIAHAMNGEIWITATDSGRGWCLTELSKLTNEPSIISPGTSLAPPNPEACVFAPNGQSIAFTCPVVTDGECRNQIFVVTVKVT